MRSRAGRKYETENAFICPSYCGSFVTLSTLMSLHTAALSKVIKLWEMWFETPPNVFLMLQPESYLSFPLFCHLYKFTWEKAHLFYCSAWCWGNFSHSGESKVLHFSTVAKAKRPEIFYRISSWLVFHCWTSVLVQVIRGEKATYLSTTRKHR